MGRWLSIEPLMNIRAFFADFAACCSHWFTLVAGACGICKVIAGGLLREIGLTASLDTQNYPKLKVDRSYSLTCRRGLRCFLLS